MAAKFDRSTALVCALCTIALLAALSVPATAMGTAENSTDETAGDGPCVKISTDPPGIGAYPDCGGGGSSLPVYMDGEPILPPPPF